MPLSLPYRLTKQKSVIFVLKGGKKMPAAYESLQAVIDSIDAIIYVADMKTYELLLINNYTRRLFGDVQGRKCWASLQQGQTGPCDFCSNSRLVGTDGIPVDTYVWEFQNTVNGRWYECRDKAISRTDGRLVRLEIASDITERKRAEERQRESEEQFRLLYERSPLGIALADADGVITDCNDKFTEIAGAHRERLIGFNMNTGVRNEQVKSAVAKALSGRLVVFEGEYVTATGSKKIVMRSIYSPLHTHTGSLRGIMLITEDISERRHMEEEREKLIADLQGA